MQAGLTTSTSYLKEVLNDAYLPNQQKASDVVSNILDILEARKNNAPLILENSEKFLKSKEKILKQLKNMYKNTRLTKYLIEHSPVSQVMEYRKIKGLVLNIEKRMSWYLNIEQEKIKCLLISKKAKTASDDLLHDDLNKYFFEYYAKVIVCEGEVRKFISVPLIDLNVSIV